MTLLSRKSCIRTYTDTSNIAIGGCDSFFGGLILGPLRYGRQSIEFVTADGHLKHTPKGDYNWVLIQ